MSSKPSRVAETCTSCGLKRGQVGSFTQWIFQDERCTCKSVADGPPKRATVASDPIDRDQIAQQLVGSYVDGRFRVDALIGFGGWGCVAKAWHPELDCPVAIKLLHPHLAYDAEKVARFKQEAQAARKLRHPNIVPVLDYGHWNGRPYLVMDFLHGHSLADEIAKKGIAKERFFDIFEQVLSGVSAAHDAGIIHRDLTPSNIFVVDGGPENGKVKILDFGLAKLISDDGESMDSLTQTGVTLGTPAYMSPEHCMGKQTDARSDIYSIGCCMYESLSGRKIFNEETVFGWMNAHVSSEPRPLVISKSPDSASLKKLIDRCLEKDPANRPQSAQQLLDALQNVRAGKKFELGRKKKSRVLDPKQHKRSVALKVASLGAISAGIAVLGMVYSVPITQNLSSELPKIQDKLVLLMPLKREWKRFDVRGTQLMNEGHFKEADEQFAAAESAAQADGNYEQQLRTLKRRALVAYILNEKDRYDALLRQIEEVRQETGDASQRQVAEAEVAKQALTFVADHPTANQIPHVQKLIKSINNAASILQQRGEHHQALELLKPAAVKAKSALGVKDPAYAQCVLRQSYSTLQEFRDSPQAMNTEMRKQLVAALQSASSTLAKTDKNLAQEADVTRAEALLSLDPDQAHKLADAVAALPNGSVNERTRTKAELVRATALARLGRIPEATRSFEQLFDAVSRLCPEDLDSCMQEYRQLRELGAAFKMEDLAKEAQALENTKPLVALHLYLSVLRRMREDYKLAVPLSEKALVLAQYQTDPTSPLTAAALDSRARALGNTKVKRYKECEPIVQQLLAVRELLNEKQQVIVDTKTWLAFVQMNNGNLVPARKYFDELSKNYLFAPFENMWDISQFVPNLTERFASPTEQAALLKRIRARIDFLSGKSTARETAERMRFFARLQFHLRHFDDALKTQREAATLLEQHTTLSHEDLVALQLIVKEMAFYQRAAGHADEAARCEAIDREISAGSFKRGHHW